MREVLPTATSPTRQTLALRCFWPAIVDVAIMGHPSSAVLCTVQTRVSPLINLAGRGYPRGSAHRSAAPVVSYPIPVGRAEGGPDGRRRAGGGEPEPGYR